MVQYAVNIEVEEKGLRIGERDNHMVAEERRV
jgi:hypothetical protein